MASLSQSSQPSQHSQHSQVGRTPERETLPAGHGADRRLRRSDDPMVALHHQLAHARDEASFDAIVVADDTGLVVAGAGAWVACEELAAYAPLFASAGLSAPAPPGARRTSLTRPSVADGLERDSRFAELRHEVDVQPVDVDGHRLLLCARGGRDGARAMKRAANGVARILGC
jgi:hypothetical protein